MTRGLVSELAEALSDALADPGSTWLPDDVQLWPSVAQAAEALRAVTERPAVSVVVPYYRDQQLLDLILSRLAAQRGVRGGLQVVVADDGSPQPPDLDAWRDRPEVPADPQPPLAVQLVRQERDGFRAAAARNLGAARTTGRVLVLLDGDTVPEDAYVASLQRACLGWDETGDSRPDALLDSSETPTTPLPGPATLAVGRRRHTDLLPVREQIRSPFPPHDALPEPTWLAGGLRQTAQLREADDASFRYVISAVMALSRGAWDVVGGFSELRGYGGEDWELAWRAWLAGVDLRYVPEAVAWHDGPDLAGRPDGQDAARLAEVKNAETARLAPLLPHPLVRGRGWAHAQPDVVAVVHAGGWTGGQLTVAVEALLRQGDIGVWVVGPTALDGPLDDAAPGHGDPLTAGVLADPRVHVGHPPSGVRSRSRAELEVCRPVAVLRLPWEPWPADLTGDLAACTDLTQDEASGVRVVGRRHTGRAELRGERVRPRWLPAAWVEDLAEDVVVERWRQR